MERINRMVIDDCFLINNTINNENDSEPSEYSEEGDASSIGSEGMNKPSSISGKENETSINSEIKDMLSHTCDRHSIKDNEIPSILPIDENRDTITSSIEDRGQEIKQNIARREKKREYIRLEPYLMFTNFCYNTALPFIYLIVNSITLGLVVYIYMSLTYGVAGEIGKEKDIRYIINIGIYHLVDLLFPWGLFVYILSIFSLSSIKKDVSTAQVIFGILLETAVLLIMVIMGYMGSYAGCIYSIKEKILTFISLRIFHMLIVLLDSSRNWLGTLAPPKSNYLFGLFKNSMFTYVFIITDISFSILSLIAWYNIDNWVDMANPITFYKNPSVLPSTG
ncbi:uncharacterized protein NEPG_00929 [Nematocida parisii ERTm1]|uniref:uncharacterized protein n=1 Tax=Nematocida parisii (strain ERTm1 / ATCC PRA-289) TaxID=881290 RepID=UPI000264B5DA|nr:uncharacterized protein NEPG_00929 [Nematocida parisii ERTm1]EIJ94262.1 hypothetical protein NEPG_00929 [Nematocida parisii ERTm1]|eukprot:XP_013058758.1 hypothetical protein NEPG_00929 [Nematocida parisii ERTm1]